MKKLNELEVSAIIVAIDFYIHETTPLSKPELIYEKL